MTASGDDGARAFFPDADELSAYAAAAAGCRACPLWESGTQTVFGEGPPRARVLLVGEQPGHEEDLAGRPFVGPAGRLLDQALTEVRIERADVYVTNVVKHFKWIPKGKRRLHQRPNASEIGACRPWFEKELELVRPRVLVCLGATAAQALLGRAFRVTERRGTLIEESDLAPFVTATVHPSSILRTRTSDERRAALAAFVVDLAFVATLLDDAPKAPDKRPADPDRRRRAPRQSDPRRRT